MKCLKIQKKPPQESDIVNAEVLKVLVGFPVDKSEIDADKKTVISRSYRSTI